MNAKHLLSLLTALVCTVQPVEAQTVAGPEANPGQRMNCTSPGEIRGDDGRCVVLSTYFSGRTLRHVGESETYRTIAAANEVARPYDVIVIHSGIYRETISAPASDLTYVVYPGDRVVINGADVIDDGWTVHSGSIYKRSYADLPVLNNGCPWQNCSGHYWRPELLIVDGALMEHVEGLERLDSPGEFYVDGDRDASGGYTRPPETIYSWFPGSTSPDDHTIEFGVRTRLFEPAGAGLGCHNVTHTRLRIIGVEFRNAVPINPQHPAVCSSHNGDVFEEIRVVNSGWVGIKLYGEDHVLRGSTILTAGVSGIGGGSDNTLIEYNRVSNNGFRSTWDQNVERRGLIWGMGSAGLKKTNSYRDTVRANVFEENQGPGVWYDTANSDVLIEGNIINRNAASGVFMETGVRGVNKGEYTHSFIVRNNVISNTKWVSSVDTNGKVNGERGECIGTSSSGDHIIAYNTLFGCEGEGINIMADNRCPSCNGGNYIFNNLIYSNNGRNATMGYEVKISATTNSLNGNVYWDKSGLAGSTFRYNATGDVANSISEWKSILDRHQGHLPGDDNSWTVPAGPGLVEDYSSEMGWRLVPGSAARGKAVALPPIIDAVQVDIDGDPRPNVGGDVGADQYSALKLRGAQTIPLKKGWNYVSLSVDPATESIESVLGESVMEVEMVKDDAGRIFYLSHGLNEIGGWSLREAYMVYARKDAALSVEGTFVLPGLTISLQKGWNLIPYPRIEARQVKEVLEPILSDVVMMKDQFGGSFHPEYGIDSIREMRSGAGYLVYVKRAVTLTYL